MGQVDISNIEVGLVCGQPYYDTQSSIHRISPGATTKRHEFISNDHMLKNLQNKSVNALHESIQHTVINFCDSPVN